MLEHKVAKIAACAAFLLLIIGGMVNATGSSLACPEAVVICHKSFLPPMTGGVLYEHGHRLFAMTVGLVQILLTVLIHRRRPELRWLGWLLGAMVLAQASFGAITVHYKLVWFVSTGHLLLGMSYFAMLVYTVFKLRPDPSAMELEHHEKLRAELGTTRTWILVACCAVFAQLLLGALVRHFGATLACIGMPACTATGTYEPQGVQQTVHMIHRVAGCLVAISTTIAAVKVFRAATSWSTLRRLMVLAPVLVAAQVTLGVFVVLSMRAVPVAVGHFAGAASLWALWMSAWLLTARRQKAIAVRESGELVAVPS
jgi:cytochrome c oxidase assembly protein subunit 15